MPVALYYLHNTLYVVENHCFLGCIFIPSQLCYFYLLRQVKTEVSHQFPGSLLV